MERMSAFVLQGHLWYPGTKEQKIAFWSRVLKIPPRFDEFLGRLPGLNCTLSYDLLQQRSQSTISHAFRLLGKWTQASKKRLPMESRRHAQFSSRCDNIYETLSPREAHWAHSFTEGLSHMHLLPVGDSVMSDSLWPHGL